MKTLFTLTDAERAADEWGANCGPAAIAAVLGKTLEDVRSHLGDFERKRYTNPTMMYATLRSLGVQWETRAPSGWPRPTPPLALVRVQWEGPWTEPGVHPYARYRRTHWVGAAGGRDSIGIFDVNCLNNGSGWVSFEDWRDVVVPWLLKELYPTASGKWHATHVLEVARS